MKKIILAVFVILMVAVLCVALTACNNATPQGQLANPLMQHSGEHLVYGVTLNDAAGNVVQDDLGTYTVDLQHYDAGSVIAKFGTINGLKVDSEGVLVTGKLESNSQKFGNRQYETGCYFNFVSGPISFMVPAYSYRIEKVDGNTVLTVQASYSGANYRYERTVGDKTDSGTIKVKGTFFDNNEFQQSLRCVTTFSNGLNLTFSLPLVSADAAESVSLTASCSSTVKQKVPYSDSVLNSENNQVYPDGIDCYAVRLSRSTQVEGVTQSLYYATENFKVNGWAVKNMLMKFSEPVKDGNVFNFVTYSLRSIKIK